MCDLLLVDAAVVLSELVGGLHAAGDRTLRDELLLHVLHAAERAVVRRVVVRPVGLGMGKQFSMPDSSGLGAGGMQSRH